MADTLIKWTENIFKDGVELFEDERQITKNGTTLKRDCKRLKACSIGLISTSTAEEWYNICRLNCEPGTIIEPFDERWNSLYNDNLALVKLKLTQSLLEERFNKSAKTLLDILERRDRDHWGKDKKVTEIKAESTDANNSSPFNITFTVKE